MVSVPNSLIPVFLRLTGANRTFRTVAGARRTVRRNALRPGSYGPPSRLRPDVRVDVERRHGWPVYTVSPVGAGSQVGAGPRVGAGGSRPGAGGGSTAPAGGLVYVHGGGWVNDVAPQHWMLAAQIAAEANVVVTLPIYPLVPFGTAREVVDTVVELVRESIAAYGPTCLAGDSAGGQIALSSALALRDRHDVVPPVTVLVAPALDLEMTNPEMPAVLPSDPWLGMEGTRVLTELWRGELDIRDPAVSPIHGELVGLGPIALFRGTRDILDPDGRLLVARARAAGVTVDEHVGEGLVHVYPLLPTAAGRRARAIIVDTIRRALER